MTLDPLTLSISLLLALGAVNIVLSLVMHAYSRVHQRQFLGLWSLGWLTLGLYHFCAALRFIGLADDMANQVVGAAANTLGWISPVAIALGVASFASREPLEKKTVVLWISAAGLAALALVASSDRLEAEWRFLLRPGMRALFAGLLLSYAALHISRSGRGAKLTVGQVFVVVAFTGYGLQQFHYFSMAVVFLKTGELPARLGYLGLVDLILQTMLGLALVTWFLETERRRSILLENRLEAAKRFEALGRLSGGMAHDFNNVLTTITGNADVIRYQMTQAERDVEKIDAAAREIHGVSRRASELVQQLMGVARGEPTEARVIDVAQTIRALEPILDHFTNDGIVREVELAERLPAVQFSPEQLEQILMNLAANAADAMVEEGRLSIRAREEGPSDEHPRGEVVIEVQDDGVGIPHDDQARVFEPFFSTKGDAGTGLGLPSVAAAVHRGGGRVELESEPGRGTTVRIFLPVAEEALASSSLPPRGMGEAVLIFDADDHFRRFMTLALELNGYEVDAAATSTEALQILRRESTVELFVVAVDAPNESTAGLISEATQSGRETSILLTASDRAHVSSVLQDGRDLPLLLRPFTTETLLYEVNRALTLPRP